MNMGHDQRRSHSEARRQRIETAMKESEAGQDRLQRTKDRIDFRTAQAVEDIIANNTRADVFAAGSDDIMVEAEETAAQPDAEVELVQLGVELEVQLQGHGRRPQSHKS